MSHRRPTTARKPCADTDLFGDSQIVAKLLDLNDGVAGGAPSTGGARTGAGKEEHESKRHTRSSSRIQEKQRLPKDERKKKVSKHARRRDVSPVAEETRPPQKKHRFDEKPDRLSPPPPRDAVREWTPQAISTRRRPGRSADSELGIQYTPKDCIERLARLPTRMPLSTLIHIKSRKSHVHLSALEGCSAFKRTYLLRYLACLCAAHAHALDNFTKRLAASGSDGSSETAYLSPTMDAWKELIASFAFTDSPPLLESINDMCQLLVRLTPARDDILASTEASPPEVAVHRALTNDMYCEVSEFPLMQSTACFFASCCRAISPIIAGSQCPDAARLTGCFELLVRSLKEIILLEVSLLESSTRSSESSSTLGERTERNLRVSNLFVYISSTGACTETGWKESKEDICLGMILETCLMYLSRKGQRIREDFVDILFALLTASRTCAARSSATFTPALISCATTCIGSLVGSQPFWNSLFPWIAKRANKVPKMISLLGCLIFQDDFIRALLRSENVGAREVLFLELVNGAFDAFVRDPVAAFRGSSSSSSAMSENDIPIPDVLYGMFKHSVVQREIIACPNQSVKDSFLHTIDTLLSKVQTIIPQFLSADNVEDFAHRHAMGGSEPADVDSTKALVDGAIDKSADNQKQSPDEETEDLRVDELAAESLHVAECQALVFSAKLIAVCCKSFETGDWDADHSCSLQVMLLSPKWRARRSLGSLYQRMINLQRAIERHVTLHDGTAIELMTIDEANRFMFAVQAVRCRLLESSLVRQAESRRAVDTSFRVRPESLVQASGQSESGASATKITSCSLPSVCDLSEVRLVVATMEGWSDFEMQSCTTSFLFRELKAIGGDLLSRFDPTCSEPASWIRPKGRRNQYSSQETRELLDKKVLPVQCGCVPGRVPSRTDIGGNSQIACSNDSCLNRQLKIECSSKDCPAGESCQNQRMQRLQYAKIERVPFAGKGSGVVANEEIQVGEFIGEYQGEVIDEKEFQNRKEAYCGERHFYFMSLTPKLYIDASRVSQITRFINHSCEPNAETQKWNAGGEPRIGIFAKTLIRKGDEITFDYGVKGVAAQEEAVKCLCGSKKCRGFLIKPRVNPADSMLAAEGDFELKEKAKAAETMVLCAADMRKAQISKGYRYIKYSQLLESSEGEDRKPALQKEEGLDAESKQRIVAWQKLRVASGASSKHANGVDIFSDPTVASKNMLAPDFRIPKIRNSDECPAPLPAVPVEKEQVRRKRLGSVFAPVRKEKDRRIGGTLAPVVRNRPAEVKTKVNDDDSDSCDDISIASPTVPVDDEDIFVPVFDLNGAACSDDEFVEAPPIPEEEECTGGGYGRLDSSHRGRHERRMSPRSLDPKRMITADPRVGADVGFRIMNGHDRSNIMSSREGHVEFPEDDFGSRRDRTHHFSRNRPEEEHDACSWPERRNIWNGSPPSRARTGYRMEESEPIASSSVEYSLHRKPWPSAVPRSSLSPRHLRREGYPPRPAAYPMRPPSHDIPDDDRYDNLADPRPRLSDPRSQPSDPRPRSLYGDSLSVALERAVDHAHRDTVGRHDPTRAMEERQTIFERLGASKIDIALDGREYSEGSSTQRSTRPDSAPSYKHRRRESVRSASPRRDGHAKYLRH
jgi:SET domain/AWS domain